MRNKWTLEKCKEDALKYKSKIEWQKKSSGYLASLRHNWTNLCCDHMITTRKPNNYWTKERCKEEALKHKTKKGFFQNNETAYNKSLKNNWCKEICYHMEITGSRYKRMIYAYEFSDNHVYVGLTYNENERKLGHLKHYSAVKEHINSTHLIPNFVAISKYIEVSKAIKLEGETLEKYKKNGWKILNKAKTGSIGGTTLWTLEKCKKDATKYKTRKEWFKNSAGAYKASLKNGWHSECCKHMLSYVWTIEELKKDALLYNTRSDWYKNSSGYHVAYINKILDECCKHMQKKPNKKIKWTLEECKKDALKYKSKKEWRENSYGYMASVKYGYLQECNKGFK